MMRLAALSAASLHQSQNKYFSANCRILGSDAVRILPNCAELRLVLIASRPGRKEFIQLYASALNSTLFDSRKWNVRATEMSHCQAAGSLIVTRPRFPRVPNA